MKYPRKRQETRKFQSRNGQIAQKHSDSIAVRYGTEKWLLSTAGMDEVRKATRSTSQRYCLIRPRPDAVRTIERCDCEDGTGRARFTGVVPCTKGSCPNCAAPTRRALAVELAMTLKNAHAAGKDLFMLTLTIRHGTSMDLADLLKRLDKGYARLFQGRAGQRLAAASGIRVLIKPTEITYGTRFGWHPHLHLILAMDPPSGLVAEAAVDEQFAILAERWADFMEPKDPTRWLWCKDHGSHHMRLNDDMLGAIADYVVQEDLRKAAMEAIRSDLKTAQPGNVSVWDFPHLMVKAAHHGHVTIGKNGTRVGHRRLTCIWREWESAMHGRHQIRWSRNARRYRPAAAELAVRLLALDKPPTDLVWVPLYQPTNAECERMRRYGVAPVLRAAALAGLPGVLGVLADYARRSPAVDPAPPTLPPVLDSVFAICA